MLQIYRTDTSVDQDNMPPENRSPYQILAEGVAFIRRHLSIMVMAYSATLFIALLYLITAVPTFTANVRLVINSKAAPGDAASVSTIADSQIAIIRSEGVARVVIQKLGLAGDPEFAKQGFAQRMKRSVSRLLGWSKPETEYSLMRYATDSFARNLSAKRVGSTYIIEIAYDSADPERAVKILNAVAETYIVGQMDAKYKSALQNERWVKDRTIELSSQVSAAKKALADKRNAIADPADDAGRPSQSMASMQGELRELEATAEAAARSYDNFLRVQRYMEATQQQPSPTFEAYQLTDVSRPLTASTPKVGIALGISTVAGLLLGIAIGMLRDLSDRAAAPEGRSGGRAVVPMGKASASKSQFDGSSELEKHREYKEPSLGS
ncbi:MULTISPECIES: hypothetical protein [unclassified Bradyrhizobium]|uniref:hypothetical protein n=1 Tax=unclassified Bradyrhizobium TaxID=2631580 RepID=UPI0020138BB6|nr:MULTISPECIES: hypothetical protein [unclassified Bradyrhizobium]